MHEPLLVTIELKPLTVAPRQSTLDAIRAAARAFRPL